MQCNIHTCITYIKRPILVDKYLLLYNPTQKAGIGRRGSLVLFLFLNGTCTSELQQVGWEALFLLGDILTVGGTEF